MMSMNEISNPKQKGGEVSLPSSCYWGIGGYFFPLCLFPFMPRCIPFPSLLIILWQAFIISLYLSLVICLRSFFLSHSCFLQSFIWLNFKLLFLVCGWEWPLLKARVCFFKSSQPFMNPIPSHGQPLIIWANEMYKNIRLSTTQENQGGKRHLALEYNYVALGKIYFLNYVFT